jgi:hypothetical protein
MIVRAHAKPFEPQISGTGIMPSLVLAEDTRRALEVFL